MTHPITFSLAEKSPSTYWLKLNNKFSEVEMYSTVYCTV